MVKQRALVKNTMVNSKTMSNRLYYIVDNYVSAIITKECYPIKNYKQ